MSPNLSAVSDKITKYAAEVPAKLREDFTQDLWVHTLELLNMPDPPAVPTLNIIFFRFREQWTRQRMNRALKEAGEPESEPSCTGTADEGIDAQKALRGLAKSLEKAHYTPQEIETVVEGLRDGLTQKEIAEQVNRSPQLLNIHFNNFRSAA
jgi:hypothetical protein